SPTVVGRRPFRIDLDQSAGSAIYVRIAEALRDAILAGEFDRGLPLPTTRELSRRLDVNRNTIVAAYRKLEEWGLARAHVGRGTFAVPPDELAAPTAREEGGRSQRSARRGAAGAGLAPERREPAFAPRTARDGEPAPPEI